MANIILPSCVESSLPPNSDRSIVYCDESGNSGPNYVDPGQPFYVLASWVVPYENVAEAAAAVELHRQKYSPESLELKAKNLLRRDSGKEGIKNLFECLGNLGCIPVYVVSEKRYCIAAKAIETYLDPLYNPLLRNAFTGDKETKQQIANLLYEKIPEDILNIFANAYRYPLIEHLDDSLTCLVKSIRTKISDELADLFEGSRDQLTDIVKAESYQLDFEQSSSAINFPALVSMLMMIDRLAHLGYGMPYKFVHDEIHAYEEDYKKWYAVLRGAKDRVIEYPEDDEDGVFLKPLSHIPAFEIDSSRETAMLQAADVLAGTISHFSRRVFTSKNLSSLEQELATPLFSAIFSKQPRVAWWVASNAWIRSVGDVLFDHLRLPGERREIYNKPPALLPQVHGTVVDEEIQPKYKVDLPLYAIIEVNSGNLMCVGGVELPAAPASFDGVVALLFTNEQNAKETLALWNEEMATERREIRRFGAPLKEVIELIELLQKANRAASILAIDIASSKPAYTNLEEFVRGISHSIGRVVRAIQGGVDKILMKRHEEGGKELLSYLTGDGNYVALSKEGQVIGRGATREEAVESAILRDSEAAAQNIDSG